MDQINAIDSALSNEGNKRSLYNTLTSMYFMYQPSDSDIVAFRAGIAPQLAKSPRVAEHIEQLLAERSTQVKDGDALPSDPTLIARDGSRTTLSRAMKQLVQQGAVETGYGTVQILDEGQLQVLQNR